jgi:adenylate cyclase
VPETGQDDISLGPFRVDRLSRTLTRDGVTVAVSGRAVDILGVLVEAGSETVSKDALLKRVWSGQIVEENNLQVQISALRKAMGEGWIVTVPGRGYRIVVPLPTAKPASANISSSKPSIAILPFTNMSGDVAQEFIADGMAEDITTALSRVRSFLVIARNSSFTYKGRAIDVRQVGRELGARYVLEGSVRRGGERLRVSAQLADAETGIQVWAERYDRDLHDIFTLQDEITEAVARSIEPAISEAERQRAVHKPPGNLSAWEAYQRGIWHMARPTLQDRGSAREMFDRAIASDPGFAPPYYLQAYMLFGEPAGYLGTRTATETATLAEPLARRAIELDPHDGDAHGIAAIAAAWSGDWDGAVVRADQAVSINANSVLAHRVRAFCLFNFRRYTEAREELTICLQLSSQDPHNWLVQLQMAITHYLEGNYSAALCVARRAAGMFPGEPQVLIVLAACFGRAVRIPEGQDVLRRIEALLPAGRRLTNPFHMPFQFPDDHERLLTGLRMVGWRE